MLLDDILVFQFENIDFDSWHWIQQDDNKGIHQNQRQ